MARAEVKGVSIAPANATNNSTIIDEPYILSRRRLIGVAAASLFLSACGVHPKEVVSAPERKDQLLWIMDIEGEQIVVQDGSVFVKSADDGSIRRIRLGDGSEEWPNPADYGKLQPAGLFNRDLLLAHSDPDGKLVIVDTATGDTKREFPEPPYSIQTRNSKLVIRYQDGTMIFDSDQDSLTPTKPLTRLPQRKETPLSVVNLNDDERWMRIDSDLQEVQRSFLGRPIIQQHLIDVDSQQEMLPSPKYSDGSSEPYKVKDEVSLWTFIPWHGFRTPTIYGNNIETGLEWSYTDYVFKKLIGNIAVASLPGPKGFQTTIATIDIRTGRRKDWNLRTDADYYGNEKHLIVVQTKTSRTTNADPIYRDIEIGKLDMNERDIQQPIILPCEIAPLVPSNSPKFDEEWKKKVENQVFWLDDNFMVIASRFNSFAVDLHKMAKTGELGFNPPLSTEMMKRYSNDASAIQQRAAANSQHVYMGIGGFLIRLDRERGTLELVQFYDKSKQNSQDSDNGNNGYRFPPQSFSQDPRSEIAGIEVTEGFLLVNVDERLYCYELHE